MSHAHFTTLTLDNLALVHGGGSSAVLDKSAEYGEKAAAFAKQFGGEVLGRTIGKAFGFGVGIGNEVNHAIGQDNVL
jgi:hypothetical protein